ncbi:MAG: hypothetical protein PHH91_13755, partial [Desulfuromonadaceae bacterium]|nr:hypothetical protein [Desulfuromonadaceae bacterium]
SLSVGVAAMFMLFFFNRRLKMIVNEKTANLEAELVERKKREDVMEKGRMHRKGFRHCIRDRVALTKKPVYSERLNRSGCRSVMRY